MKIIAELGSNFRHYQDLKNAIHLAHEAGAHAIKFQWFCQHDLYGLPGLSKQMNILPQYFDYLYKECKKKYIEFMCTVFNPDHIDFIDKYITTYKVASSDMCYVQLLERINQTKKDVYLSTGAHHEKEIEHVLNKGYLNKCKVTLMYCVSAYPANNVYLPNINMMRRKFNLPVGFSDHSTDIYTIPWHAVYTHGASVLEKHFNPHDIKSPDAPHSLSFDDFRSMVGNLRGKHNAALKATSKESDMILMYNRRLVALKPIKKGDIFMRGINYGVYRCMHRDTNGGSPFLNLDGKKARVDYETGDGVFLR